MHKLINPAAIWSTFFYSELNCPEFSLPVNLITCNYVYLLLVTGKKKKMPLAGNSGYTNPWPLVYAKTRIHTHFFKDQICHHRYVEPPPINKIKISIKEKQLWIHCHQVLILVVEVKVAIDALSIRKEYWIRSWKIILELFNISVQKKRCNVAKPLQFLDKDTKYEY